MLREKFKNIFDNYLADKQTYKQMSIRKHDVLTSANALKNELPGLLKKASSLYYGYKFKGSVGQGQLADLPHLCIFDTEITYSAQRGYYIVYLFKEDMSSVYLSLNQGWTQYENKFERNRGKIELRKNTILAQNLLRSMNGFSLDPISLTARVHRLGVGYEIGNICSKRYDKENLPSDEELINDLRNLVGVYKELKGLVGKSILDIKAEESESEFQNEIQTAVFKELPSGPIPRKEPSNLKARTTWGRDKSIAQNALERAQYQCEADPNHQTFISLKSGRPFMEAHHLIPMEFQGRFEYSLDVPENVLCLCPTCHRIFHNAEKWYKALRISLFYDKRVAQLEERAIITDLSTIIGFYEALEED